MTYARDLIHQAARCEAGTDECVRIHDLLVEVEDDRVHVEADKIRRRAEEILRNGGDDRRTAELMAGVTMAAAMGMDPYELRDGELVRKSDGKIMYCERCTPSDSAGAAALEVNTEPTGGT
jgi:hypothetical protein